MGIIMSLTINTIVNISIGIGLLCWTIVVLVNAHERNQKITRALWTEEYNSHACGRAIAAIANFHALAIQAAKKNPRSSKLFAYTDDFFRKTISVRFAPDFEITSEHCKDTRTFLPVAELYLRNADEVKPDTPNYTYRLTENTYAGDLVPWK